MLAGCVAVFAIVSFGGCSKVRNVQASFSDVTNSISKPETKVPESQLEIRNYLVKWDRRYQQNPNDKFTARSYARALRAARRTEQAVAVLQKAVLSDPKDNNLLADYGKALADAGKFQQAAAVLDRAQVPERPSWSIASAQGSVADQIGNHALAQEYYRQALKIAPGEPRVLSNLGLSYALSRELDKAEKVMRQAAAHPRADTRVLQNLSLVLALRGKFEEAEALQRQVLPASDARANIMAIRRMIAQSNTWREISAIDKKKNRRKQTSRKRTRPSRS
ncbi:MAG: tetratricopeptide repeat protein [Hyphomicrobiales bacterium]|nr:tetratricopeptide repeat protein [Hyphomicrobiales bacterium]